MVFLELKTEFWVPVNDEFDDWGNFYEVSNLGNVRSLDRVTPSKNNSTRIVKGKILSQSLSHTGYFVVGLSINGKNKQRLVSRVVANSFHGYPGKEYQARHLNGNRLDNRLVNIDWGTGFDNALDKKRHGTCSEGIQNPNCKLTVKEVLTIIELYHKGLRQSEIADITGAHRSTVNHVLLGRTWKHITGYLNE